VTRDTFLTGDIIQNLPMNTEAKAALIAALKNARVNKDGTMNGTDRHRAIMAARKFLTDDEVCQILGV
jgi:hypothetical protein